MNNPYAPPVAQVADPASPDDDVRYGGFWMRFVAFFVDGILLSLIIYPLVFWLYWDEILASQGQVSDLGVTYYLLTMVFPLIATVLFWKYRQATPGKMLFGLKIVDAKTRGALSTGQLFGRYFAYLVSIIPLCLGYLWIAWDDRKQSFHDKLAGTLVIRK